MGGWSDGRESPTREKDGDDDDDERGDGGVDAREIERDGYEYASGGDVYGDALSRCVSEFESFRNARAGTTDER